jgi:hypothetical protein
LDDRSHQRLGLAGDLGGPLQSRLRLLLLAAVVLAIIGHVKTGALEDDTRNLEQSARHATALRTYLLDRRVEAFLLLVLVAAQATAVLVYGQAIPPVNGGFNKNVTVWPT